MKQTEASDILGRSGTDRQKEMHFRYGLFGKEILCGLDFSSFASGVDISFTI